MMVMIQLHGQDDTFICNGDLIITLSGSGAGTNAFNIELNGSAASFGSLANYSSAVNSTAFNSQDGYIYGITSNYEILRLKSDGTSDNLGKPPFLPNTSISAAGDFDANGIYWIHHRGNKSFYGIDVNNGNTLVDNLELQWHSSSGNTGKFNEDIDDLVFDPLDKTSMYTYQRNGSGPTVTRGHLLRADIDPTSPEYGFIFSAGRLAPSEIIHMGAMFFDSQGFLFGYGSNQQPIFQNRLIRIDRDPATANLVAVGPGASANDGCSCPFSMFVTKKTPDSYNVCLGEPIEVTYQIGNSSNVSPGAAIFTDTFPSGFVIEEIIFDEVFGVVRPGTGVGTNKLIIDGITFANKVVEFKIRVTPSLASGTYQIHANLTNLPARFGQVIKSDDPETFASNDPTVFVVDYEEFKDNFDIGEDVVMCEGEIANFIANVPLAGTTITWSTGDIGTFASTNKTETIIATAELGACSDADTVNVEVVPYPVFDLGVDLQPCADNLPTLGVPFQAGQTYSWSTGENNNEIVITESGPYSLEIDDRGCKASDSINVDIIFENYSLTLDDLTLCEGESINIDANNPWPVNFEWTLPSGSVANGGVLFYEDVNEDQSGDYILNMEYLGCEYTENFNVDVNIVPESNLDSIERPCYDALEYTLSVPDNSDYLYTWSTGDNVPEITVSESGIYTVEINNNGCIKLDTSEIIFVFEEFIEAFPDVTICEGDSLGFLAENNFLVDYVWTLPDGTESTDNNIIFPQIDESEAGLVTLSMVYNQCNFDTDFNINVNAQPELDLDEEATFDICDSLTIDINSVQPGSSIAWSPADIANCQNCETTTLTTTTSQFISVTIVDDIGCETKDSIYLNIGDNGLGDPLNIPNIFSPNDDRTNDFFVVPPLCYEIKKFEIFDRWGNNVYSKDLHPGDTVEWDGRNHVGACEQGVYTWVGEFLFINSGELKIIHGDVTIVR